MRQRATLGADFDAGADAFAGDANAFDGSEDVFAGDADIVDGGENAFADDTGL